MVLVKCVEWKGKFSESSEVGFVELWGGGIDRTDRSRFLGGVKSCSGFCTASKKKRLTVTNSGSSGNIT